MTPARPEWLPEWLLVSDIDNTLTGDSVALEKLMGVLHANRHHIAFGVASGRSLELIREAVETYGLLEPDLVISSVGSEIYGEGDVGERYEEAHRRGLGARARRSRRLTGLEGLSLSGSQPDKDPTKSASTRPATYCHRRSKKPFTPLANLKVTLIHSHGEFLDVLPERAAKGKAVRFVAEAYGLPLKKVIVAGDSGNDADLLVCGAKAVVVGNYSAELEPVLNNENVYLAEARYAAGVLEGLRAYGVLKTDSVTQD